MRKFIPIAELLRRTRPLALHHQAKHLALQIRIEQGGNVHKTSVRIRELQDALEKVQRRRLKREKAA